MQNLISIVLPVYNGAEYLKESIDSILAQTYTNWELLIVDDCSTDATPNIAREYEKCDSRIRYYRNSKNLRLPRNLNKGFSLASGQYLTWTSDDNIYLPNALGKMVQSFEENPGAQFVFANVDVINESGEVIGNWYIPDNYQDQVIGNNIVGACFMYTREVYNTIGDYQHGHLLVEDYDYWQRIFSRYSAVPIFEVLYQYRRHSASLTGINSQSTIKKAQEKVILCNRPLFGKLTMAQKYYYYNSLRLCEAQLGRRKYSIRYWTYRVLYYTPMRIKKRIIREISK